jgi:hypothetical protein
MNSSKNWPFKDDSFESLPGTRDLSIATMDTLKRLAKEGRIPDGVIDALPVNQVRYIRKYLEALAFDEEDRHVKAKEYRRAMNEQKVMKFEPEQFRESLMYQRLRMADRLDNDPALAGNTAFITELKRIDAMLEETVANERYINNPWSDDVQGLLKMLKPHQQAQAAAIDRYISRSAAERWIKAETQREAILHQYAERQKAYEQESLQQVALIAKLRKDIEELKKASSSGQYTIADGVYVVQTKDNKRFHFPAILDMLQRIVDNRIVFQKEKAKAGDESSVSEAEFIVIDMKTKEVRVVEKSFESEQLWRMNEPGAKMGPGKKKSARKITFED